MDKEYQMNKVLFASLAMATALFAQAAPEASAVDTAKVQATPASASVDSAVKASPVDSAAALPAQNEAKPVAADTAKTDTPLETAAIKDTAAVASADTTAKAVAADTAETALPKTDSAAVTAAPLAEQNASTEVASADTAKAVVADTAKVAAVDTAKAVSSPKAPAEDYSMAAVGTEEKKKVKKEPLFKAGEFVFDINASFEIQAGKVLWTSEDDKNSDNFEEWWGRANLGLETHSNDFNGRILVWMYPGDLMDNQYHAHRTANGDTSDSYEYRDLFEIHEAWAEQHTKYLAFKLGRWEFTQKNGDYFGNYVDGYYHGFKSGTNSENALQFTLTPTETMTMDVAFISTTPNLNTGDLRLMFRFHDLSGIEFLNLDLGYRTNVFDLIHDDDTDVRHTISLQGKTPIVSGLAYLFLEGALMGIDAEETYRDANGRKHTRSIDMVAPITGGLLFTPRDYRIILEAEYIHDRQETEYADKDKKHIKDVLAAFYIEKPLSKRFTLSFGAHSYGTSRDFEFNGNLIGKIN